MSLVARDWLQGRWKKGEGSSRGREGGAEVPFAATASLAVTPRLDSLAGFALKSGSI